jgi:P4 family phage/plasmid primase-like protien
MAQAANHDSPQHPAIEFISAVFGPSTELPLFFQTLANDPGDADEAPNKRQLMTREVDLILGFVAKHDRNRRGTFVCVATLAEDATTRNKANCRESVGLHSDIDFKGVLEDEPTIRARIAELRYQPTIIVRSGGGLHLYWLFREAIATQDNIDWLEGKLRRLAEIVAGDVAVCEVARLMRLPGTHNSKRGDMREVVVERLDGPRYEPEELEEWLAEQAPVLTRKAVIGIPIPPPEDDNPYLKHAREFGFKPRLDVEAALAGMGEGNIHDTQLRVSASLISAGQPIEEVVGILMEATRQVAGPKWNWRLEEKALRSMCDTAAKKFPPREPPPFPDIGEASNGTEKINTDEPHAGVIDLGEAKAKRKPKKMKATAVHIVLAEAVLAVLKQRGEELMFTTTGAYRYTDNLWRLQGEKDLTAWLNSELETGARGLKMESANRLVNEARAYILREPDLQAGTVPFDTHRQIPTRSGLVDPYTGTLTPPAPEHWCTWRIEYDYDPEAKCPFWLRMLDDVFEDRSAESRALHVQLLQEILGCGLIDRKGKALSRALILVGGSNYGKSSLIDVMSGLFGEEKNTTPMDTLATPHGLMPFCQRIPWVLHEAFDAGKWHISSVVKAIISGDKIQINVKGGKLYDHRVSVPIFWGSNTPPQFKEATDAITNRIVVIECRRQFDLDNPIGAALEARNRQFEDPQGLVLALEMEGVLAWAVAGLQRALARGHFVLPQEVKDAAEDVKLSSNIVAEFVRDCIEFDPAGMVSTADFGAGFASWWMEHKGEDRGVPSGERITVALKALGEARIGIDRGLRKTFGRYYVGISLNGEGKRHWLNTIKSDAFVFQSRKASTTDAEGSPNQMIPDWWDDKKAVRAMRVAYERKRDRSKDDEIAAGHAPAGGHEEHDQ